MKTTLSFCIPGDPTTLTGGYLYDRHMTEALRTLGWRVAIKRLDASFPDPAPRALEAAAALFAAIPDDTPVLIDGLALAGLAELNALEHERLRLAALIHHPTSLETGLEPGRAAALERAERASLSFMRLVICTSQWTARTLAGAGVPPARVQVVRPGTPRAPRAGGSGSATLNVLSVGTVTPRKAHGVLIEALAPLRAASWHLHIVGSLTRDAGCADALRARLAGLDLTHRVTLHGEVSDAALESLYDRTDLFVLASELEGYGMAIAEALMRGLPIVATHAGAIPELVGDAGRLVAPRDVPRLSAALAELIADPAARADLGERALGIGRALPDWQASAQRLSAALTAMATA